MIRFVFFGIAVVGLMGAAALWSEGQRERGARMAFEVPPAEERGLAESKPVPPPAPPAKAQPPKPEARPLEKPKAQPSAPPVAVARSRTPQLEEEVLAPEPFLPEAPAEDGGSDEADGADGADGGTVVARAPVDPDESAALIRRLLAMYDAVRE